VLGKNILITLGEKKFKKLNYLVKKIFPGIYLNLGVSKVSEIFILILNYYIIYLENPQNIFSQCNSQKSLRKKCKKSLRNYWKQFELFLSIHLAIVLAHIS
jgi:hypothetical protein